MIEFIKFGLDLKPKTRLEEVKNSIRYFHCEYSNDHCLCNWHYQVGPIK